MKIESSWTIVADRETVWTALLAPELLASCIPGCKKLEATGEDTYDISLTAGVASITATYTGSVSVTDKRHPDSYRMVVEGTGSGGFVKGEAVVSLAVISDGTEVSVVGDAQVSGVVARVGQRLMGSASKMLMNQFFNCMKTRIESE